MRRKTFRKSLLKLGPPRKMKIIIVFLKLLLQETKYLRKYENAHFVKTTVYSRSKHFNFPPHKPHSHHYCSRFIRNICIRVLLLQIKKNFNIIYLRVFDFIPCFVQQIIGKIKIQFSFCCLPRPLQRTFKTEGKLGKTDDVAQCSSGSVRYPNYSIRIREY